MNNAQFVLSYELLTLLRWLADHDADYLKDIIKKALSSGLQKELRKLEYNNDSDIFDEMQHSITDFLHLLETLLFQTTDEHIKEKARHQKLLPAIDQIDTNQCDDNTVLSSLEKTTTKLSDNPEANAKEVLFKEILAHWEPRDSDTKN